MNDPLKDTACGTRNIQQSPVNVYHAVAMIARRIGAFSVAFFAFLKRWFL